MNSFRDNILHYDCDNWSADYNFSADNLFTLSVDGKERLGVKPVSFGKIGENVGMVSICRDHEFMEYENGHRMEIKTIIPFGSEPHIGRTIEMVNNHIKFITDVDVKGYFPAEKINIDDLVLPGEWVRYAVLEVPESSPQIPQIEWKDFASDEIVFESESPFLILLFESADGVILEIGTGSDLWRWQSGQLMELKSDFKVKRNPDGVSIKRDILIWPEETDIPSRNWRFKWYCSWMNKSDSIERPEAEVADLPVTNQKFSFTDGKEQVFKLINEGWHNSAQVVCKDKHQEAPCFFSNATIKHMKRWIRSTASHNGVEFIIDGIEPHVCHSSSHASRPKKTSLYHFDMTSILDFWFWADRQLMKNNSSLTILPAENSSASQLPSMNGLKRAE